MAIDTANETLIATIYLDGGTGGDKAEYNGENSRIQISRTTESGATEWLKNECAYLEPISN